MTLLQTMVPIMIPYDSGHSTPSTPEGIKMQFAALITLHLIVLAWWIIVTSIRTIKGLRFEWDEPFNNLLIIIMGFVAIFLDGCLVFYKIAIWVSKFI